MVSTVVVSCTLYCIATVIKKNLYSATEATTISHRTVALATIRSRSLKMNMKVA